MCKNRSIVDRKIWASVTLATLCCMDPNHWLDKYCMSTKSLWWNTGSIGPGSSMLLWQFMSYFKSRMEGDIFVCVCVVLISKQYDGLSAGILINRNESDCCWNISGQWESGLNGKFEQVPNMHSVHIFKNKSLTSNCFDLSEAVMTTSEKEISRTFLR